jgi:hypothetical protein
MIRWILVVTQAICSSTFWAPRANAKDPGPGSDDGVAMAGEPEPVPRDQDPARLRLLDDPDVVVESLLDGRAVGLPEGHHLEAQHAQCPGELEAAEAAIDEEDGGLLRRLPAAACRRHG